MEIKILQPAYFTECGQKPNQEDALFPRAGEATTNHRIFMVCDGIGGHEKGEVASNCVAETIGENLADAPLCSIEEMKEYFQKALTLTYDTLDQLDADNTSRRKMGTTLTFLALCADGILIAHIGDSRVYQLRPGSGILFQTRDHSLVYDLIAAGELTEEEARTFPQRNIITRAVQPNQEYRARPTFDIITDLRPGDIFFLCSDGVIEKVENDELQDFLLADAPLDEKLAKLRTCCLDRQTHDNTTFYAIELSHVTPDASATPASAPAPNAATPDTGTAPDAATPDTETTPDAGTAPAASPITRKIEEQKVLLGSKGQGGKHKGDRPVRRMFQLVLLALLLTLLIGGGIYLYHSYNDSPRKSSKRAAAADSTGGAKDQPKDKEEDRKDKEEDRKDKEEDHKDKGEEDPELRNFLQSSQIDAQNHGVRPLCTEAGEMPQ